MRKTLETELKVGGFILFGLILVVVALIMLGSTESVFVRKNQYTTHYDNVEGLIPGAKVVMGGIQVGVVGEIRFDPKRRDVEVVMNVQRSQGDWIRSDSTVQIMTQGMLGDKFLEISRGGDNKPVMPPGSDIPNATGQGLSAFLSKSDQLMVTLQSIAGSMDRLLKNFEYGHRSEMFFEGMAKTARNLSVASERFNDEIQEMNLKKASKNLNEILAKINNGTGTLGALVNDPGLYDDVKALMGGANRNRVMRNLVRQTIRKNEEEEAAEKKEPKKK